MEKSLNRIELIGNIGYDARVTNVRGILVARFNMATSYIHHDTEGYGEIETTWHSVVAWNGAGMPDFEKLTKGSVVHVVGRLRINKYTTADGEERSFPEVVANSVTIIK